MKQINGQMDIFQYLSETSVSMGCGACIGRKEGRNIKNVYDCQYMTDTGCEKLIAAKNQMLDAIAVGEETEICREQCCRGCTKFCMYRCSQQD